MTVASLNFRMYQVCVVLLLCVAGSQAKFNGKLHHSTLTLITPCGVNMTPKDHFDVLHENHQHHSSEIL